MTTARLIEQRIIRDLLRRQKAQPDPRAHGLAELVISAAAVIACLLLLGTYLQELLWVLLAVAAVLTLGTRTS